MSTPPPVGGHPFATHNPMLWRRHSNRPCPLGVGWVVLGYPPTAVWRRRMTVFKGNWWATPARTRNWPFFSVGVGGAVIGKHPHNNTSWGGEKKPGGCCTFFLNQTFTPRSSLMLQGFTQNSKILSLFKKQGLDQNKTSSQGKDGVQHLSSIFVWSFDFNFWDVKFYFLLTHIIVWEGSFVLFFLRLANLIFFCGVFDCNQCFSAFCLDVRFIWEVLSFKMEQGPYSSSLWLRCLLHSPGHAFFFLLIGSVNLPASL